MIIDDIDIKLSSEQRDKAFDNLLELFNKRLAKNVPVIKIESKFADGNDYYHTYHWCKPSLRFFIPQS